MCCAALVAQLNSCELPVPSGKSLPGPPTHWGVVGGGGNLQVNSLLVAAYFLLTSCELVDKKKNTGSAHIPNDHCCLMSFPFQWNYSTEYTVSA